MKQRIVIIEASEIVSAGLMRLLEGSDDFVVVGQLPDLLHYEQRQTSLRADLVLLNPLLVDYSRRHAIRELIKVRLVAIETVPLDGEVARHYDALLSLHDSQTRIESKLKALIVVNNEATSAGENYELSDREKEILIAVTTGMMNKEIADRYNISIHTVISHRKNITRKTGIKSVPGLTVYAMLNNLIGPDELK